MDLTAGNAKIYNTKVKIYNDDNIELIYYGDTMFKGKRENAIQVLNKAENQVTRNKRCSKATFSKRNLRSSVDKIYGYTLANKGIWHTFITLTFADEITDIKEANKKFHSWQVTVLQKFKDFRYLCVPEFQKNGRVHYHLLTNILFDSEFVFKALNENGEQIKTYNKQKKRYYLVWNIKYWKHGFSTVLDLDKTDHHFSLAAYMTKYLFKDFDNRLYGHQKVMVSKGLKFYDVIYSFEDVCAIEELELQMLEKGYLMYSEKPIMIESDNKYLPPSMTILKFKKLAVSEAEMDAYNDYVEDLYFRVEDIKKNGY